MIAYISIGNSDDKLSQREWAAFQIDVRFHLRDRDADIFGAWHSYPDSIYQNACFCVELPDDQVPALKNVLSILAEDYHQNAIAFNVVTATEMIGPPA